ncbi:kinesin-II 95 kDa subunit-like [Mya arenaria]|uniref:kinesin-II 95 kDa subunit-like n=1 Tax=Mya arenaria TaxID=6604 RepID=UPI0022E570A1|nr:kinesin-II 95 kDa subunit-like [Mya arenaria]XP_052801352.1 kinesin-II 95 kDa subunit-like [Mya arenaria]
MGDTKIDIPQKSESVRVVVRCRPMASTEESKGFERVIDMNTKKGIIELKNPKLSAAEPKKTFTFDSVYDWNSKQRDLYDETFRDLVDNVLQGFNGTIFAYGQTGTGKTFTMQGVKNDPELRGVIPNSFEHIFNHISNSENQQYLVRASYLEIYQEEIRDLLSKDQKKRLELKERPDTGVYVKDLSSFVTKSVREIEHVMNVGNQNRSVGATDMNEHSSRSHAIFIITIECSEEGEDGENHIRVGRLNLVDLAGSERQAKTKAEGQRLKEATKINLSLSALGNVISALVDGKSTHIPYRDSKLTRLLQDSLGGNAKTVMVANIGPADYNFDETMSTLRYANRAKNIKNKPKINEDPKDALLREFQEEIARLKASLAGRGGPKKKKKRRTRRNDNGEIISESEEEDDDEEEEEIESKEEDLEAYRQEQQANLEKEKESILNNRSMMQAEKDKILQEIQDKESTMNKEKEARDQLESKIKAMESKLLVGNIVDHTNEQQRALEQRRREIAEQQRVERDIQQKLEEKEEAAVDLQETYVSLQQEVEVKTKKLKKLFAKLQATKQEIQDLQEEHVKERQELEQTQNELTRELKLKLLIIENFIPIEDKVKIQNRANFDEEQDTWVLRALANKNAETMAKRPKSALGNRRPVSEYARMAAAMGGNPRFKGENIIMVELDMPNRTTRDYDGPQVAPRIQAALDAALQDEADLELDGSPAIFKTDRKRKDAGKSRPKSALKSNVDKSQLFPKARGLVNKN